MNMEFPALTASDVEVRVARVTEKGCQLLLYKDARCDQNILDKTVGSLNWQRHHSRDNSNCTVSIYDSEKQQWVEKEDTGTESYTEKEKGLASDSFKRACFNWGIGRELYTSPFIWINAGDLTSHYSSGEGKSQRWTTYDRFTVEKIAVNKDKQIYGLSVLNQKTGKRVFTWHDKELDDSEGDS